MSIGSDTQKYLQVSMNGKKFYLHQLVWFRHYGLWPSKQLNHINGNPHDNRLENLEEVTNRENNQRKLKHINGALPGAHFHKRDKKWMSSGKVEGKTKYFGYYNTELEAHEAYMKGISICL